MDLLAFPDVVFDDLVPLMPSLAKVDEEARQQISRDAMYANYIARQEKDVEAVKRDESHVIPADFDFTLLDGLSNELKQKLTRARPGNLAQAGKVEGMTPSALALLLFHLRRKPEARRA